MTPCDLHPSSSWLRRSGGPWLRALLLVAALATPVASAQETPPAAPPRQLSLENKPWQGDFEQMLERRVVRVLIPYSWMLFFSIRPGRAALAPGDGITCFLAPAGMHGRQRCMVY